LKRHKVFHCCYFRSDGTNFAVPFCVFIDQLLFGPKPLSESVLASVRYAMKRERNQDTGVMEPRKVSNAFVKTRASFIAGC
jgi:hypothetical protein